MAPFSDLLFAAGITTREASDLLGIDTAVVTLYERGDARPTASEIQTLKGLIAARGMLPGVLPLKQTSAKSEYPPHIKEKLKETRRKRTPKETPPIANVSVQIERTHAEFQSAELLRFYELSRALEAKFSARLTSAPTLNRGLVSFQANKSRAVYRWYKFKEAFSADLIEYLIDYFQITHGKVLDPFAGSGTTLFAASEMGLDAEGIELLPIGQRIIDVKRKIDSEISKSDLIRLTEWGAKKPWQRQVKRRQVPELRITAGAYSSDTMESMQKFLATIENEKPTFRETLHFALLCVLENISFTRKDGQYLRWDHRSARRQGARPFDKGYIPSFDEAMSQKLLQIADDLSAPKSPQNFFARNVVAGAISLKRGSCLDILPELEETSYSGIVTSPPYCNRYDYTRTYALELALLGVGERELVELRQAMLSCTVENRSKDLVSINPNWSSAIKAADNQVALQMLLEYLDGQKASGALNNNGIPRMVRGYFYEMACVIYECGRVLTPGAPLIMVNDNVRYAGASVPVDLILSDFAQQLGFSVEKILVLPKGKGNSSQQMGAHGRDQLRKCVYIWKKS